LKNPKKRHLYSFALKSLLLRSGLLLTVLVLLPLVLTTCGSQFKHHQNIVISSSEFFYDLNREDGRNYLGFELEEISGLTWLGEQTLGCIQDEEGKFYRYDFEENKVKDRIKFASPGDFEGIEVLGKVAFAVKSNGDLFQFSHVSDTDPAVEVFENGLSAKNDVEGLGFHPELNALMIACKNKGEYDDNNADNRAFYLFDLTTKTLSKDPFLELEAKDLEKYTKRLGSSYNDLKFKPSGIAFHPIEKKLYILSSPGSLLVVLNRDLQIDAVVDLDKSQFRQPEGICFSSDGEMFISSEGQDLSAYILRFRYRAGN
jgi:uncharacterized protein YjiK